MLRALITLALVCLLQPAFADERAQTQQQLDATRQDITELKKLLGKLQEEKSGVQKDLRGTETEMGKLEKQVQELQKELKKSESELERLDAEKKKLQSARVEQQRLIAIQARAAYQSGRQEYLKLLLNQEHPEKVSRTLTYYNYLNRTRLDQLATFNDTLREIREVEQGIQQEQSDLVARREDLEKRQAELAEVRKERQAALAKINADYRDKSREIENREQDQAALNKVLKTIEETLARQAREAEEARQRQLAEARAAEAREAARRQAQSEPKAPRPSNAPELAVSSAAPAYGGAFANARGKLPWPVDGRLVARFGSARGDDPRAKWDGVLIAAGAGTRVKAVHDGRVVFADWLRGAGQLVIIDHGNGYLSLYGHNQSLLKSAGDVVKAGDAIATVGASGGQEASALYFAIRQQGRPTDPVIWCRAQG